MEEYDVAVTEVLDILENLPENVYERVPKIFVNFLKAHKVEGYNPNFDYSNGIDKLNLNRKTKVLLAMIYRNFICYDEQRIAYDKILCENEAICEKKKKEKYNPDNIFNN